MQEIITKHFIQGNRLRLSFCTPEDPTTKTEINTTITTVHGEVVIVDLPNNVIAAKLREIDFFEVTVGTFGSNTYCRCLALPGESNGQSILLYIKSMLEMLPQRREDFRLETVLPLYIAEPRPIANLVRSWEEECSEKRVGPPLGEPDPEDPDGPRSLTWKQRTVYEQHIDLSAGGIMFFSNTPVSTGSHFAADLFVPAANAPYRVIPTILKATRCTQVDHVLEAAALIKSLRRTAGRTIFRVCASFERIIPRDQELLVSYTVFGRNPQA